MRVIAVGIAALVLTTASAAHAEVWRGRLYCEAAPGLTDSPLNIEFEVNQAGQALSYTREIRGSAGGNSGGVENGSGTIAGAHADITGHFAQRGASDAIHYAGDIAAGHMRLTGEQVWTLQRLNGQTITRACRADLAKLP